MPTNFPDFWKFKPLTIEEMIKLDCVLEGTLCDAVNQHRNYEALVLDPKDHERDGVAYTHPTLFQVATGPACPEGHMNNVRVSLRQDELHLQFMNPRFGGILHATPTFVSAPVKLSGASVALVDKLREMTAEKRLCAMGSMCEGAVDRQLEMDRSVLVMTDEMRPTAICRKCFKKQLPTGWVVLLHGWHVPPRARDVIWDIPETKIVKP